MKGKPASVRSCAVGILMDGKTHQTGTVQIITKKSHTALIL